MTTAGRLSDISVSDAQERLASVIDQVRDRHEPVFLADGGHRVAAIIGVDDLDRILQLAEDMEDIRAAESARAEMREAGKAPVPWDDVKAQLGLT